MKNAKRKCIFLIAIMLAIICASSSAIIVNAIGSKKDDIPIPTVKKDVYVYDEGNIIDDDIEKQLNVLLREVEEQTGAEVAIVTVESLLGREIEDYANNLANTLGIGKADEDNGVLLLISKSDERVRLEIGKGLEGCLNDSKCGRILDNYFVPYREKNEYSEGTYKTIEAVVSVIAKEYGISSINGINEDIAQEVEKEEYNASKKALIFIVLLICFIVLSLLWFLLSDASISSSTSFGKSSGGGFGGGSFGGGSFGGGGASR